MSSPRRSTRTAPRSKGRIQLASLFAAALMMVAVPGTAWAQNCMGYRLSGGQHAGGAAIDERGEFGGVGVWYSGLLKNGISLHGQHTVHEVDLGSAEFVNMTFTTANVAFPILRKVNVNEQPSGLCGFFELGVNAFQGTSGSNYGVGVGYAMNQPRWSVFAGPVLGQASSGDYSDSYVNVIASATVRLGFLMLGAQTTQPIQPDGAQAWMTVRAGYAIGRASAITRPWVRNSSGTASGGGSVVGATAGDAATSAATPTATQSGAAVPGPTAGLKPYTIDDIEAMVKNNVPTTRILDLTYKACLGFRITDAAETQLRRVGADQALLDGLRTRCYSAS